jgi:hypothetical protein
MLIYKRIIEKINMKIHVKQVAVLIAVVAMIMLVGCEKNDSETLFGNSVIYIPQSTVSGGQNLEYLVPSGVNKDTHNFKVDTLGNTVNVYLGVTRSGLDTNNAYTVNVETKADTINTLIANGLINLTPSTIPVVLLPENAYTLPSTVSVLEGKYAASFYLAIKLDVLKTYAGKKVALCVAIKNPTKYILSTTNDKVIILIDVDALKLP